jgi:iron complex transport system substrate-binding protein
MRVATAMGLLFFKMSVNRHIKLLVLAFLLSFAACKSSQTSEEKTLSTREVIDDAGRQIRVPQKPTRVVSLSPHLTEIVFAVGGEGELVGVTSYCDYPAKAKTLPQVGDTIQPEIKRIVELKPQLVLVSTSAQMKDFRRQMDEANIPYYVTNPRSLEGIFRMILTIGDLLGQKSNAEKLVADMRSRARTIEEKVKDKQVVPVFYQISPEPVFTAGRDSYITDIIRIAGGQNVAAALPDAWTPVRDTSNFLAQPEAVIIPVSGAATKKKLDVAPFLQNSDAVTNNRVYGINDYLLARPGPRIVDGLEELARVLQPEAFK